MKDKLKKIFEKVDPSIFPEKIQAELTTLIESKIKLTEEKAFESGYAEGKKLLEKQDEEYTEKLKKLVETYDEDHSAKLQKLVEKIDTDHTKKLEKLVEDIDADHTKKFEAIVEKIDRDHTAKLEDVISLATKQINEAKAEVSALKESKVNESVEAVSKYLDTYLEEAVPTAKVTDAAKLARLTEAFNKMKEILVVNEDYVQTEIREAVQDAKCQLDEKDNKINQLMAEKVELKANMKKYEAEKLLESTTKTMSPTKKAFIEKFFEGSDVKEISARLDEAVKAFDKENTQKREMLIEKNKNAGTKIVKPVVKQEQITENASTTVDEDDGEPIMESYVSRINKSNSAVK
jgi:hypothetical protein